MRIVARDFRDSRWLDLDVRDGRIDGMNGPTTGQTLSAPTTTGSHPRSGTSRSTAGGDIRFPAPTLTVEQVAQIVRAQGPLGTARLCPTLITAPADHMLHGVQTIAAACEAFPDVVARVRRHPPRGAVHLGARWLPWCASRRVDPRSRLEPVPETSGGVGRSDRPDDAGPRADGAIEFIRRATSAGVAIALGHTAADGATIEPPRPAGATLSTHLGNGIASRTSPASQPDLAPGGSRELSASFIADGHHLDLATLRVLARAKGPAGTILVSDASPLAGLPPGSYGEWAVDPSGKIVVAGTPYLAGSNQGLEVGLQNLLTASGWTLDEAIGTVTVESRRGCSVDRHRGFPPGEPADIVIFRRSLSDTFILKRVCVNGRWELG